VGHARVHLLPGGSLTSSLDPPTGQRPEEGRLATLGEPYYPEGLFSPLDHKFWISELIREKVYIQMGAEIPYSTTVEVHSVEDRGDANPPVRVIEATILTTNPRHKGMIIGRAGRNIKEIGGAARKELEAVLNCKVFLHLDVQDDPDWPDRLSSHEEI
jgi:GTP-binding protein Era